jgi:DNA-directed RNA polymerase, mitochondrial
MKAGTHGHSSVLERPVSDSDLAAWNAIQATPWAVNTWVLDVMLDAWTQGLWIAGLEIGEVGKLPPRLDDETWAAMSQEDRSARTARLRDIHSENASIKGRSHAIVSCLEIAELMRNRPAIWFPHTKDFRGRIYSAATRGPHPQGNDISKALIHFAEGKPLGQSGEFWLRVRAANCFGMDKLSLEDRVAWTLSHQSEIGQAALSPSTSTWWTEADEPWGFLATCYELAQALISSAPESFVSHLPVPLDGSCNGLQHLSAMGLDPVGALATNLTPATSRQDVYEEVANRVRLQVEQDVFDGIDAARVWHGKITRQVTKRAVMTTPYGVTDRGIRKQLLNDGHVPADDQIGKGEAADYLRDRIVQALGDTVASAKAIMAWLQVTADRLARAGLPFDWTTPTGGKVRQGYFTPTLERITMLSAKVSLWDEDRKGGLNVRKQALGSAPNYIHSFDAAHLTMTVNAAVSEGIDALAMIHDSYGTHAANTTRLSTILREQFVALYQVDWLKRLKEEIAGYAPHVQIDDPPERGDFDVSQVIDAPFFFS